MHELDWDGMLVAVKFWQRVDFFCDEGCWLYDATGSSRGYAQMKIPGGRFVYVHRWAYEHCIGPIPDGLQLDHECHTRAVCAGGRLCRHRRCVNPAHLAPVTNDENARRRTNKRPACPAGHEYTAANSLYDSRGYRLCRKCRNATAARQRSKANA